jgi:hypothetical protein
MQRRQFLKRSAALLLAMQPLARVAGAAEIPREVAGISLPRTPRAQAAAAFARARCPPYLFNHCMRTYLFGALALKHAGRAFQAEEAFIAASLHDLGLLPAFESAHGSFETDGANAAEHWASEAGLPSAAADRIWHAVQMHDGAWALTRRQGPEAMLVALGAGSDVDGPEPNQFEPAQLAAVIAAFPRLDFKRNFTTLLIEHCQRKPDSQHATWLESVCRAHVPGRSGEHAVEEAIAAAPFAE